MHLIKSTIAIMALSLLPYSAPVYAESNIPPEIEKMHAFLGLMQKFYGIVNSMDQVSADPTQAAIMQMFKIQEIYEQKGKKAEAAEIFRQVLKDSNNPTLRNAATFMLGDILKDSGQKDEAIAVLKKGLNENLKRAQ